MAQLTRYTSFRKLKLSRNVLNKTDSDHSIGLSEFEEFINTLKKATLKKSKVAKRRSLNGQKSD